MISKRQKQVLDFIKDYQEKYSYAPSLDEIRKKLKLASVSTAHFHVEKLKDLGFLNKEDNQPRSIDTNLGETLVEIPLVGSIAAGYPIEAIAERESIAVPKSKLPKNGTLFALRVKGDSMIDENIDDGDIIVAKSQSHAENGQRVVALIGNQEATLKKIYQENEIIRLQPANKKYNPLFVEPDNLQIQGVVVDVVKKVSFLNNESQFEIEPKHKLLEKERSNLHLNTIIHGDAIEELKKIPDRSVDLIILDPPYWKVVNEHWDYKWRTESDYAKWCFEWFTELSRIIKLSGSLYLFGYMRNLFYLYKDILDLGFIFRQQIIISKGLQALGGRATRNYKMFPNVTESLLFFTYDSKPFIKEFLKEKQNALGLTPFQINQKLEVKTNGGGLWSLYTGNNILAQVPTKEMWLRLQKILKFDLPHEEVAPTFNTEMGITDVWSDIEFYKEKRYHPTQKPLKLIERVINASTNKNMIVLDPFVGAGSTPLACIKTGRQYIGIDNDEKYVEITKSRIKELKSAESLGI